MPIYNFRGTNYEYEEMAGSPRESMSSNTFRVTREFGVDWAQRWIFLMYIMGFPSIYQNRVVGSDEVLWYIHRSVPQGYRSAEIERIKGGLGEYGWMYPISYSISPEARIIGLELRGNVPSYEKARITVEYEAVTYKVYTDAFLVSKGWVDQFDAPSEASLSRYITIFRQPTAEYLTLPFGSLYWCRSDKPPVHGSHGRVVGATEYMIQWHQVPGVPAAVGTHIGTVNDADFPEFSEADGVFPPSNIEVFQRGTLLLTSIEIKPYKWFLGQQLFDITYKFKYFSPPNSNGDFGLVDSSLDASLLPINEPFGHNHFLRLQPNRNNPFNYDYIMLSHNGIRPRKRNESNISYDGPLANGTDAEKNPQNFRGRTVYAYKNFNELFYVSGPENQER